MHTAKRSATQRDSSRHYGDERQGSVLCERSCRVLRAGRGHWHAAVSAPTCACGTARRRRGGTVSPKCCPTGQDADRLDSQGDALVRGGSSHVSRNGASRPALCVVGGRVGHRSEAWGGTRASLGRRGPGQRTGSCHEGAFARGKNTRVTRL